MSDATNDNGTLPAAAIDAHGQAALLLIESLIHGLVARSGLTIAEAIEIVESAIDVQNEMSDERGRNPDADTATAILLAAIARSLGIDGAGKQVGS